MKRKTCFLEFSIFFLKPRKLNLKNFICELFSFSLKFKFQWKQSSSLQDNPCRIFIKMYENFVKTVIPLNPSNFLRRIHKFLKQLFPTDSFSSTYADPPWSNQIFYEFPKIHKNSTSAQIQVPSFAFHHSLPLDLIVYHYTALLNGDKRVFYSNLFPLFFHSTNDGKIPRKEFCVLVRLPRQEPFTFEKGIEKKGEIKTFGVGAESMNCCQLLCDVKWFIFRWKWRKLKEMCAEFFFLFLIKFVVNLHTFIANIFVPGWEWLRTREFTPER